LLGNRELSRQAGERSALIRSPFALAKQQGTGISRKVKKELDAACITPALDPKKVGAMFRIRSAMVETPVIFPPGRRSAMNFGKNFPSSF
jgi:hypothetical protein